MIKGLVGKVLSPWLVRLRAIFMKPRHLKMRRITLKRRPLPRAVHRNLARYVGHFPRWRSGEFHVRHRGSQIIVAYPPELHPETLSVA